VTPTHPNRLALAFVLTTVACERPKSAEPPTVIATPVAPDQHGQQDQPEVAEPDSVASTIDPELVMLCVTAAVETMGWLGRGAHAGHFIATARDAGLIPEACDPLASASYDFGYPLAGGGTLHWFAEDMKPAGEGEDVQVTLRFTCHDSGCGVLQTRSVTLPPGWFCLGWIHGDDHGSACFRSEPECEQGRIDIHRDTTPCSRDAGSVYCATRGGETRCFPSPWACTRESGGTILDGTCKKTDH
jgi:hypothetical protein